MKKIIVFNKPKTFGGEIDNIKKISKYNHYSGNGYFSKKCSRWLIKNIKCKEALLVHSCTAALEMCAILLNIKTKDEIIMPSYTFVSTANAFVLRGGTPVFVDINKKTLNIDFNEIEKAITKKTKAIVVVHYAGMSCDMEQILKIAKKYKLYVIEDAAQAILSSYKGRPLGSIGDLATLSFHETKNIHCGEGGALLINNKKFINRAKIIRDKGTNRDKFNNNLVKKYSWIDIGSSYALSEINAAYLYAQLKKKREIHNKRLILWNRYNHLFKALEDKKKIFRPYVSKHSKHNSHIYFIIIRFFHRDRLIKYLGKNSIKALFHYVPLHSSNFGKKYGKCVGSLKNTNLISKKIIRLPMHLSISYKEQVYILKKIIRILN
jgi:dTDP-4-amino-4,6-dideoxygalactose transaminase